MTSLVQILATTNTWISFISGIIYLVAYIWAGTHVLNTDKVQRFLVSLWIIFMIDTVLYLIVYILILSKVEHNLAFRISINTIIILTDIFYSVGHWIFSFQYFKSAKDVINKIEGRVTDFKKLSICNWIMIGLIIISYIIALVLELIKIIRGTFLFGNSSLALFILWGLVTVIVLFFAIFKI